LIRAYSRGHRVHQRTRLLERRHAPRGRSLSRGMREATGRVFGINSNRIALLCLDDWQREVVLRRGKTRRGSL
jgi:hypothetical protein